MYKWFRYIYNFILDLYNFILDLYERKYKSLQLISVIFIPIILVIFCGAFYGVYIFIKQIYIYIYLLHLYPLYSGFQVSASVFSYELVQLHHNIMYSLVLLIGIVWWCTYSIIQDFGWNKKKMNMNFIFYKVSTFYLFLFVLYFDWFTNIWCAKENINFSRDYLNVKDNNIKLLIFNRNFKFNFVPTFLYTFFFSFNEKFTLYNLKLLIWLLGIEKQVIYEELLNYVDNKGFNYESFDIELIVQLLNFIENNVSRDSEGNINYEKLFSNYNSDVQIRLEFLTILKYMQTLPSAFMFSKQVSLEMEKKRVNSSIFYKKKNVDNFFKVYNFKHSGLFEVIWTFIPTIVISTILIPSGNLLYSIDSTIEPLFTFKVIGNQWYWSYEFDNWVNVNYNGFDSFKEFQLNTKWSSGKFLLKLKDIETFLKFFNYQYISFSYDSNILGEDSLGIGMNRLLEVDKRLIVPSNVPIRFIITSSDVLHSFAVPRLGIKVDAIPGRLNKWNSYIQYPGLFFGQCSELCGPSHGYMPVVVHALPYSLFIDYINNWNFNASSRINVFVNLLCPLEDN